MKKKIISLLATMLFVAGIIVFGTDQREVQAAETTKDGFVSVQYTDLTAYREENDIKAPTYTDGKMEWIFAGWYQDEDCIKAYTNISASTTSAYAKFVPADVLSVRLQLTAGTEPSSPTTNMRLVSSVDSLQYKYVGFEIYYKGATKPVTVKATKVYERIVASVESGVDYNYSPKVMDVESQYFVTATLINIANKNFGYEDSTTNFYIRPYWQTLDGTTVYGVNRYVNVKNGLDETNVNIPVKMDKNPSSPNVTVAGLSCDASVAYYDGTYAHMNITVSNRNSVLKSLSTINVTAEETTGSAVYRNLQSSYNEKSDTSWYDIPNRQGRTKFSIATSADLYGFAKTISDSNRYNNKTVYLVSDIEANQGYANKTSLTWDNTLKADGKTTITTPQEPYNWTPIGSTTNVFNGVFDGQGHTISGIYLDTNIQYAGMFAATGSNAEIKNFSLKNSYFYHQKYSDTSSERQGTEFGSIVGNALGTFESIYSDAIVLSNNYRVGGLIGATANSSYAVEMKDCWFAGAVKNVTTAGSYYGGLIGLAQKNVTVTNCLNTGSVENTMATTTGVGAMIGYVGGSANVNVSHCVNTRTFSVKSGAQAYGLIIGKTDSANTVVSYCYSVPNSSPATWNFEYQKTFDNCSTYSVDEVAGVKAFTVDVKNLFVTEDEMGYWSISTDGFPVLTSFAKETNVASQQVDVSWYDEAKDEYILQDASDFYGFALLSQTETFEGKVVKLGADIELNKGKATTSGWDKTVASDGSAITDGTDIAWMPIGTVSGKCVFNGTFDGQMYTISGVYLDATSSYQGLFSGTGANAEIKNFYLKNSYFKASATEQLGSVVGNAVGTFEKIYSDAIVAGYCNKVGGLFGATGGKAVMNDCWFAGSATINSAASYLGGLIGNAAYQCTITNCLNTAELEHKYDVGTAGIGGLIGYASANVDISYSINTGDVKRAYSRSANYGLFIGRVDETPNITYSHSVLYTNEHNTSVNKTLVGDGTNPSTCHRFNSDVLVGINALTTTYDNAKKLFTADEAKGHWSIAKDSFPVLSVFEKGSDVVSQAVDTSWYDEGQTEFVLMDSGDLYGLALLSKTYTFEGKDFKLGADITVNKDIENPDFGWLSIGDSTVKFQGDFDGQMHTISGIYLDTTKQCQGLFGDILGDVQIANFSLVNSYFYYHGTNSNAFLGAVAGRASGTIKNIYSNATVEAIGGRIGGIVGSTAGSATSLGTTIINCWNAGVVSNSTPNLAGIIGWVENNNTTISNCLNTGNVSTTTTNATPSIGGLIGYSSKSVAISNSLNAGALSFNSATAGYGMIAGNIPSSSTFKDLVTVPQDGVGEYNATGQTSNVITINSLNEIKGTEALNTAKNLFALQATDGDYEGYWSVVLDGTPVLTSFAKYAGEKHMAIDTSWYNSEKSNYELKDVSDLYGLAVLSYKTNFEGKTIELANDITVNADIENYEYGWLSIGDSDDNTFKGNFDGQMHTISGIYLETTKQCQGLFGDVIGNVRNFSLINSCFVRPSGHDIAFFGAVAGRAAGTFENIYVNATVESSGKRTAGIIGSTANNVGALTITNCWSAGSVSSANSRVGSLVGYVDEDVTMKNCLNTGAISTSVSDDEKYVGGLIGDISTSGTINLHNCLNAGSITYTGDSASQYGMLIGKLTSKTSFDKVYTVKQGGMPAYHEVVTAEDESTSNVAKSREELTFDLDNITGTNAFIYMSGLFAGDGEDYWVCVENATPVLKTFAKAAGFTIIPDVELQASSDEVENLRKLYTGKQLYQGELHNHAFTWGNGQNDLSPGDDGEVTLAEWKNQMLTYNLDFAASLDHNQSNHITHNEWVTSKFVYGTELNATIKEDGTGETIGDIHFDMIFKTPEQLDAFVDAHPSKIINRLGYFYGGAFTKTEFKTFIKDVINAGGFLNLPHPLQNDDYITTELEDYYFKVLDEYQKQMVYGMHVITYDAKHQASQNNYEMWHQMLAKGYRVYATAGSDNHQDLTPYTLTSIYATTCGDNKCDGSCEDEDCTGYDKGNMIPALTEGNFVAGSVGIKMSVGNTLMGGECDFTNQRVVVDVDKIHAYSYNASHKYRLDVMNEEGIVYYTYLTFKEDSATGDMVGDAIAFNADADCKLYRVVITDVTTGTRIAIGNPIWNSNQ